MPDAPPRHHMVSELRKARAGKAAPAFADRMLPIDEWVARRAAKLHVPDPTPAPGKRAC